MRHTRALPKIGYLVKTFPKVSETFILQEILELERMGIPLTIFSLQPPTDVKTHPCVSLVRAKVHYLPAASFGSSSSLFQDHRSLFSQSADRYVETLCFSHKREEQGRPMEFLQARSLALKAREEGIDHIHAHFASEPTGVAELTHLLTGIPFSFTAHAKDIYLSPPDTLNRKMNRAQFVVTCTEYNRRYLQHLSTNSTPIHRIYHGIDATLYHPNPHHTAVSHDDMPILLSIGRFREKKGFLTLIKACHFLKTAGYRFHCRIIGYGPFQSHMEGLIGEFDLKQTVIILGKKTQEEVIECYKHTTIFALPCEIAQDGDRDGIPNVLVEAMAMRLPVVSTDVSGIPELIAHNRTGMLVPQKDPRTLAKALQFLLAEPETRERIATAGYEKINRDFQAGNNARLLKKLFAIPSVAYAN